MEFLDAEMSDDAKGGDGGRGTGRALGVEDGREVVQFPVGYPSLIDAHFSAAAHPPSADAGQAWTFFAIS